MAFQLGNSPLSYQEMVLDNPDNYVCTHYLLEEGSNPKDNAECALCSTNWRQRLQDVVEQTVDSYTTN